MEFLKIIIFEYILGYVLQGFAIVLGVFALNKQKINVKKYILASTLVITISFLVRMLPISFGVHTIFNILFLFLVCIFVLKMTAYSTIRSASFVTMFLLICEMIDVAVMLGILGKHEFESRMVIPLEKAIIGLPGVILFTLIIVFIYLTPSKPQKVKEDNNGKVRE